MGGEELKWRQLKKRELIQGPHFSPRSTAKTNDKSTNLSKNGSDVVTASVYSEKIRMKKLMMMKMIIIITRKMVPITGRASASFSSMLQL